MHFAVVLLDGIDFKTFRQVKELSKNGDFGVRGIGNAFFLAKKRCRRNVFRVLSEKCLSLPPSGRRPVAKAVAYGDAVGVFALCSGWSEEGLGVPLLSEKERRASVGDGGGGARGDEAGGGGRGTWDDDGVGGMDWSVDAGGSCEIDCRVFGVWVKEVFFSVLVV